MTARRFDLWFTGVLLLLSVAYLVRMQSYPDGAGRVPAFVAVVAIAALGLQLVISLLRPGAGDRSTEVEPDEHDAGGSQEQDSYDTLIALHGERRTRFLSIAIFTVVFYVGVLAVGFVLTSAVLVGALMLFRRERPGVVLACSATVAASSYALIVALLGLPVLSGFLIP